MYVLKSSGLGPPPIRKESYLSPEDIKGSLSIFHRAEVTFCSPLMALTCQNKGVGLMLRLEVITRMRLIRALVSGGLLISMVL